MNTLGIRIRKRREELGLSQAELAKKLGYKSRSSINKIEIGDNDLPQSKIVVFARALDVTPSFLMGWDADKEISKNLKAIRVPVLGRIPAGVPIDAIEDILDWEELDPQQFNPDHEYFGLVVRGDSMYPEYLDGDIIIVQQTENAECGKDVVAYVNGFEATLKRLYRYENGSLELRPVNPAYESKKYTPEEINTEPVVIRGIVKELRRKK